MSEELLTAAQMRAIEQAAISAGAVSGAELMERAGARAVEAILAWRPEPPADRRAALALCGPGANGGDGFVVARLLAERGWAVEARLLGEVGALSGDAAQAQRRWARIGETLPLGPGPAGAPPALVIDAVFGTGLNRPLGPETMATLEATLARFGGPDALAGRVVAVDAPSGLCLDSGRLLCPRYFAGAAALTATFHAAKLGHALSEGPETCGALVVGDIGLAPWRCVAAECARLAGPGAAHVKRTGHKYAHGHALVLAGGVGRGGAARLAARAALRAGAGLVTLCPPPAAVIENAARLDAVMLRPVADAAALTATLEDPRIAAVALGMGLGVGERARALTAAALASDRAVVLDADALTSFREDPAALWSATHRRTVLTPHMGEFAGLFPDLAEELRAPPARGPAFSRLDAAKRAAARAGCVVLLKGPDTIVAGPQGAAVVSCAAYARAAPWLATAGAGDVLAGLVVGLMARGWSAEAAAAEAAWLHVEAARAVGPGLIAEDLPDALPGVFARMAAPDFRSRAF